MNFKLRFFNFFRNILRLLNLDRVLVFFTNGKGYSNFFVKCIPQNYHYPAATFRRIERNGICYNLDLSEYMEWAIYFGLNVEHRSYLYPSVNSQFVVIDVGANIGETMLNFALIVGSKGKVFAFEPVPFSFQKLSMNLSLNEFTNVIAENLAISDKAEVLYFDPATYYNSGGIFMKKGPSENMLSVKAVKLDEYINSNNFEKIDFIKIDVEGFELNVLKGAVQSCHKFKPALFIEVNDDNLQRQGASESELLQWLKSNNYDYEKLGMDKLNSNPKHYDILARYKN